MFRLIFLIYTASSYLIFEKIYQTTQLVIDEAFHIPQGLEYCNYNFSTWDPKITTLPGLYFISTIIFGPLGLCSAYWLRFTSFLAGLANTALFYIAFSKSSKPGSNWASVISAINLSILPCLYFFNNLYYTDVASLTTILLVMIFASKNKHFLACICGVLSIFLRQTNVIWIGFVFGEYAVKNYFHYCLEKGKLKSLNITERNIRGFSKRHLKNIFSVTSLPLSVWFNVSLYACVFIGFISFVFVNGGVVVGDKSAHVAVIHIPQLLYYALFSLVFAWPHFLIFIPPFIKFFWRRKLLSLTIAIVMVYVIYSNTLVHPYLLADNRHFTFYIWNRLYEKIPIFRYAIIPLYLFSLYCIFRCVYSSQDVTFFLFYIVCTSAVLILQKMIEVRYFLVPFVLLRLRIGLASNRILAIEFIYYVIVNFVTLRLFFVKDIYWSDFDYVQKLIW